MALAAADAEDRCGQLLALTERLTERLAQETLAFERRRPHEAAATIEETGRLANLYRHESLKVKREPALLAGRRAARIRLLEATKVFDTALARHERAVSAAKTVTEGIVRALAEEIAATRAGGAGYGAGGRAAGGATTAITLNRRA